MSTNRSDKKCYTVKELQEILDVSRPTVYALLKRREFHSIIVGGKNLISKKSFDAWLDGYSYVPYRDVSVDRNKILNKELNHMKVQNDITNIAPPEVGVIDAPLNQKEANYQEIKEKSLQNLVKAYLMIDSKECME